MFISKTNNKQYQTRWKFNSTFLGKISRVLVKVEYIKFIEKLEEKNFKDEKREVFEPNYNQKEDKRNDQMANKFCNLIENKIKIREINLNEATRKS